MFENDDKKREKLLASFSNILNEDLLHTTMNILALYILVWEAFKKMVIELPKSFFFVNSFLDANGKLKYSESEEYQEEIGSKGKDLLRSSLRWFVSLHAITDDEVEKVLKIRKRRNEFVHEMNKILFEGISEADCQLFVSLLALYRKIDVWWIKNVVIDTTPLLEDLDEIKEDEMFNTQALLIDIMLNVALGNTTKYKELREMIIRLKEQNEKRNN